MALVQSQLSQFVAEGRFLLFIAIAPLFLLVSQTTRGRLTGLAGVAIWASFIAILNLPHNERQFGLVGCTVIAVTIMFIIFWLPDTDFIRMVFFLAWFDPRLSRSELRAARQQIPELLARVEALPDSWTERPIWPVGVLALVGQGGLREGHYYLYRPEQQKPGERLGLVIALHGHGGNSRLWLEIWKAFADKHRFAVICPTYGYGNWEQKDGVRAVERSLAAGRSGYGWHDPDRVFLAGISQGGCGVGRAGAELAEQFAGLVFISPTMELDVVKSAGFAEGWMGKPVLVIHGERDRHVKPRTVKAAVERMDGDGVIVTTHYDAAGGHLLLLAKTDEVMDVIGKWAESASPATEVLGR
jgi:poly(3-hydroxybutyrate) depolymerase